MKSHKDLKVWQDSINLVEKIYEIVKFFPKDEIYGLTSQIKRCAVSIPSNIAEGAARNSKKEFTQFLYISLGSLSELETQLIISKNLKFIPINDFEKIENKIIKIRNMIQGLIKYNQK